LTLRRDEGASASAKLSIFLVGRVGIEPTTKGL
jgi:hypothetical protein